jgi:hypothetical protein
MSHLQVLMIQSLVLCFSGNPFKTSSVAVRWFVPTIDKKMKEGLKELNRDLPRFAQITDVEIVDVEFAKTPKKNIKRYLYT